MACSKCGGSRRGASRSAGYRPAAGPVSNTPAGVSNNGVGPSPAQLRALGLQANIDPLTQQRLDAERLRIEKLRREAVRRALNQ